MDASDILGMLAGEIEAEAPRLAEFAHGVATTDDDGELMLALEQYAEAAGRIGAAAGNLGLAGIEASARLIGEGAMLAPVMELERRQAFGAALGSWPGALLQYLRGDLDGGSAALVELAKPFPDVLELTGLDMPGLASSLAALPDFSALLATAQAGRPTVASDEDVSLQVPRDVDAKLFAAFLDDAPDQAAELSGLVDLLAHGRADEEAVSRAKRIAHTFKGSANIIGIRGLANLAHHTEDILEFTAAHLAATPTPMARTLVDAAGCMEAMVYSLMGAEPQPANARAVLQGVLEWAGRIDRGELDGTNVLPTAVTAPVHAPVAADQPANDVAPPSVANEPAVTIAAPAEAAPMMRVPLKSVEEMLRLAGENASLLSALAALQRRFELQSRTLDEQFRALAARIADLEMVVDVRRPAGLSRAAGSAEGINSAEGFDALEMDHYNEVHGATRALTEAAADARSVGREVQATVAQLARLLGEGQQTQEDLQFHTLGMRLAPLSSLSARLQRAVRQAASATGRDATLIIEGDAIEVDGEIVNQLADPLLHMLRNAVDHGIEPPEARIAAGKPRQGRVHLSFARAGQQLVVTCRDDGAGLDLERIRTKAEWLGLIAPGTAPGEAELARVILLPGFSTRDAVSEVSGRGIGLDVVRERVERMGGSLDIATTRGMGTTLTIRLQASLAVLLALMIEVDGQPFAVPCHSVSAGLAAGQASVEVDDSGARFVVGEDHIPARAARALLGYEREFDHIDEWSARPALLVGHGDDRIAVAVDRIVEVKELFMRKTGEYLAGVPGFAGASVLGDGAVVPILDFPGLLRAPLPEMPESAMPAPQARFKGRVLAVDDSLSVRDMISDLLRDAGYEVETAIDGMAALRKMETFLPQVLITDLEMPNLNGLELTARLRRDPRTAELPVVMITSRSQDKHRAMAAEAGVTRYLTKPYTDDRLLEAVSELMGGAPAVAETSESLV